MSLFNHIKRAFGLGANYDSDDSDFEDATESAPDSRAVAPQMPAVVEPIEHNTDKALSADIFDGVIKLFNNTQPEFVRECMDTDAQKEYILRNIDSSLQERLEKEVNSAKMRGQMLWEEQMRKLDKEVETLRHEKETLEQKREESKSQRLSAERQKRALIERVHDLETQILTLEAEKEQYILENRSMLNKLRVASVTSGGASEDAVDEIERLSYELEAARKKADESELETEHHKAIADAHVPVMEYLLSIIDELVKEVNAGNDKSAEELDKVKEELCSANKTISRLNKKINALTFAQEQNSGDISTLSESIREKDSTIAQLRKEIEELQSHAIFDISEEKPAKPENKKAKTANKPNRKPKQQPRISAIDELLESTDWFVAPTLPENQKEPEKDDDFGYKAPTPRKVHPDDDKQLSLW